MFSCRFLHSNYRIWTCHICYNITILSVVSIRASYFVIYCTGSDLAILASLIHPLFLNKWFRSDNSMIHKESDTKLCSLLTTYKLLKPNTTISNADKLPDLINISYDLHITPVLDLIRECTYLSHVGCAM